MASTASAILQISGLSWNAVEIADLRHSSRAALAQELSDSRRNQANVRELISRPSGGELGRDRQPKHEIPRGDPPPPISPYLRI